MKTSWWQKFTIRGSVILAKNLKGRNYPKFANIVVLNNRANLCNKRVDRWRSDREKDWRFVDYNYLRHTRETV